MALRTSEDNVWDKLSTRFIGNILSLCYSVDFVIGDASSLLLLGECLLRLLLYDIDQHFEQLCPLVGRDHIDLFGSSPSSVCAL